ncbi:MAG: hypothetical protein QW520_01290 [Methanomassiliicoccales archaeon]
MRIEIYYESKSGNGKKAMTKLAEILMARGAMVGIHHLKEVKPKSVPQADVYVFSSPTRIGRPIATMRRFAKKVVLPPNTKYAVVATYLAPQPDKKTGKIPTEEELAKYRRNIQIMDEMLGRKGEKLAELSLFVRGMKGPMEEGWESKLEEFADKLISKR